MNKPIRTIAIFCLLLFLALMINATYLQYYRASALDEHPLNRRVLAAAFSSERGAILVDRKLDIAVRRFEQDAHRGGHCFAPIVGASVRQNTGTPTHRRTTLVRSGARRGRRFRLGPGW